MTARVRWGPGADASHSPQASFRGGARGPPAASSIPAREWAGEKSDGDLKPVVEGLVGALLEQGGHARPNKGWAGARPIPLAAGLLQRGGGGAAGDQFHSGARMWNCLHDSLRDAAA